jgi:hypothetical protein
MPSGPRSPGSSPGRPVNWPTTWAGDDRPGEGYPAKTGRLTAARHQAEEIIRHEYGPLTSDHDDDCDDQGEPSRFGERPVVVDRNHPSWADVDAEQQERIDGPAAD